jgi:4-hydroxy-tetrahydrodipicolinate synthase
MCAAALDDDFATADKINQSLNALHQELFIEANPIPAKYAVSQLGLMQNNIRLPLTKLGLEHQAAVDAAMAQAGINI